MCGQTRTKKLRCWKDFDQSEEIEDERQNNLGLACIRREKLSGGGNGGRSRLMGRGNQKAAEDRGANFPILNTVNTGWFFFVAASKG